MQQLPQYQRILESNQIMENFSYRALQTANANIPQAIRTGIELAVGVQ